MRCSYDVYWFAFFGSELVKGANGGENETKRYRSRTPGEVHELQN